MAIRQREPDITAVRRFNRFYTRQIGVLRKTFLDSSYSLGEARVLHQALNMDAAALGFADPVAATPCHIGQPVALADGTIGALRISADARLVSDGWGGAGDLVATGRLTKRLDQIATVFEKLRFLLANFDRLATPLTAA